VVRQGCTLPVMPNFQILSHSVVHKDSHIHVTIPYERDGVQRSCVFVYPESLTNPEDPKIRLEKLLAKGENPTGPISYNAQGSSLSD
jgi:hypothetical protein